MYRVDIQSSRNKVDSSKKRFIYKGFFFPSTNFCSVTTLYMLQISTYTILYILSVNTIIYFSDSVHPLYNTHKSYNNNLIHMNSIRASIPFSSLKFQ